jgi:hypothetical protein
MRIKSFSDPAAEKGDGYSRRYYLTLTDSRLRGRCQNVRLVPDISESVARAHRPINGYPPSRFPSMKNQIRSSMTERNLAGSIGPSDIGSGSISRQAQTSVWPRLATSCVRGDAFGALTDEVPQP